MVKGFIVKWNPLYFMCFTHFQNFSYGHSDTKHNHFQSYVTETDFYIHLVLLLCSIEHVMDTFKIVIKFL